MGVGLLKSKIPLGSAVTKPIKDRVKARSFYQQKTESMRFGHEMIFDRSICHNEKDAL